MIGPVRNENGSPARDPLSNTRNLSHNYCIIPVDKVYDKTVKNYRDRTIPFSGAGGVCPESVFRDRLRYLHSRNIVLHSVRMCF